MTTEIQILTDAITTLGENPLWDPVAHRLHWIDVFEGVVFRSTPDGGELTVWRFPSRLITSFALRADGGAVVTAGSALHLFDLGTGEAQAVFEVDGDPLVSFNDGKVDRQGRFVTGTVDGSLFREGASDLVGRIEPPGRLYRLDTDLTAVPLADGIGATNGPCFSTDGSTLYCGDSWARCIYAFDYDVGNGAATNRRVFTTFEEDAVPDGATVDEDDFLWVAAFSGAEVRRYAPDGTLDRRVPMPVQCPTSVAFGGPDLDVLFVTSQGRGAFADVAGQTGPLAGRVFAVHGLGVRGVPERRFDG